MKKSERSLRNQATQLVIPTQEDFQVDLAARCRHAVQRTIQVVLDEELERLVGAGAYQRSDQRVDVRNGTYDRRVVTTTGEVGDQRQLHLPGVLPHERMLPENLTRDRTASLSSCGDVPMGLSRVWWWSGR